LRTAEQLRYLILASQREGNRTLMTLLSEIDLTPAQSEALRILADHGPLALKELGDMLVCDSGTSPSRIVDKLVAAGLVHREAGERDRRQIRLSVTPQGADRAARVRGIEDRLYDSIDSALSADDAQSLLRILRLLTEGSPARDALEKRLAAEGP
jgi:DNA-binding MarR family transcriptional regulator